MTKTTTLQPWDEAPMRRDLVRVLTRLPRARLDLIAAADLPSAAGCYGQWFATPAVEPVLGRLVASGRYIGYLGVASNLRERIGRYRQSIRGITAIREQDIWIAALPCTSLASALFAERAGIEELSPPMQGMGWGSKVPGSNRKEQSPIDALFPGRRWSSPTDRVTEAKARLQVLSCLINLDPAGPRWPALPIVPASPAQRPNDNSELATVTPIGRSR